MSDILSDPGQEYRRFHELSAGLGAPPLFYELSRHFVEREGWKGYPWLLDLIPMSLKGCTAVDVGCKYGHAIRCSSRVGRRLPSASMSSTNISRRLAVWSEESIRGRAS